MNHSFARVVCLGDSITACGRFFDAPPLGSGYAALLHRQLSQSAPPIAVTNFGFDGFTAERLLNAVRQKGISSLTKGEPSVFAILAGINDIGRMMNTNRTEKQKAQLLESCLQNMEELLELLIPHARRILLMEPFVFAHPLEYRLWLPQTRLLSEGLKKIAAEHKLSYLPLQKELDELAAQKGFDAVTADGIHLMPDGHQLVAQKIIWELARPDLCAPETIRLT